MNESQRQEQRPVALTINVLKLDTEGIIEDADERNTVLCSVEVYNSSSYWSTTTCVGILPLQ